MKRRLAFWVCYCITFPSLFAQLKPIAPLEPEAAELFKYTNMPVSPLTGVPQVSYQLYEINTGKIKLPITLSYHASGIKVTQRATWVGLGWSLVPGGAISRTVRGSIDEDQNYGWFNHTASLDDISWTTATPEEMNNWNNGTPDPEPDFFNYNFPGKSGRFIFSRDIDSFVTIPYDPVIIKQIVSSNSAVNNTYEITDDDGARYYFERKTNIGRDDETGLHSHIQEWSLTRIISDDNRDTVYLNYDYFSSGGDKSTDVVTTFSKTYFREGGDIQYNVGNITPSTSYYYYGMSRLKEIVFRQGKVVFYANTVRTDYGGAALDSVVVYSKNATSYERVRKVSFAYDYFFSGNTRADFADYRLKLLSFTKEDIKGGQPETYRFDYNSTPLPRIFSYAADYWGFYNGAKTNTSLMPNKLPVQDDLKQYGVVGNANRRPDDDFIMAGMLNKITYPTGGYTTLQYEANKYKTIHPEVVNATLAYFKLYGTGRNSTVTKTADFQVVSPNNAAYHPATLTMNFSPFSPNAINVAQYVAFKDLTTGTTIATWSSDAFSSEYEQPHTVTYTYSCNTSHTYQVYVAVNDLSTTFLEMIVTSTRNDSSNMIKSGGGIRVQSISSFNNDNILQKKEVYKYGPDENGMGYMPYSADEMIDGNFNNLKTARPDEGGPLCGVIHGGKILYFGQPSYSTVNFQGATVIYPVVTKYEYGNGVPNGKTIYQYLSPNDYAVITFPNGMGRREFIDNTLYDVMLRTEQTYKYNAGDQSYSLLKKVTNNYSVLPNVRSEKAVRIWKAVEWLSPSYCGEASTDFGYVSYRIRSGGYRLSGTKVEEYDENGNKLVDTVNYTYNPHGYPTRINRLDSKGRTISNVILHPGDHAASDAEVTILNKMVTRNIIRQPYWKGNYVNDNLMSYQHTSFKDQWSANADLIAPKTDSFWYSGGSGNITPSAIHYQVYGKYGNILQVTEQKDITSSYTWNADETYPVSQTVGAPANMVLYDGFEDAGTWSGVNRDGVQAHTGRYAGLIENAQSRVNPGWKTVSLTASTKFKYSGWIYSNGPSAAIALLMKRSGEAGAYSYIDNITTSQTGKWVYVEKEYTVPADVVSMSVRLDNNGSGKVWFDDVRLRPSEAQMTTYTYTPLVGVTSKSDEGNHTVFYEYDGLNRLKLIKDQNGKILKQYDYQYQKPITQ